MARRQPPKLKLPLGDKLEGRIHKLLEVAARFSITPSGFGIRLGQVEVPYAMEILWEWGRRKPDNWEQWLRFHNRWERARRMAAEALAK